MSPNLSHLFKVLKVNMLSLLRVIVDDEGSVSILVNTADLTPCYAVCRWVWTSFRSSHPEVFLGKVFLKICKTFTGKLHIFRTPFLKNASEWLLLIFNFIFLWKEKKGKDKFNASIYYRYIYITCFCEFLLFLLVKEISNVIDFITQSYRENQV